HQYFLKSKLSPAAACRVLSAVTSHLAAKIDLNRLYHPPVNYNVTCATPDKGISHHFLQATF
ncbi:MAG TPA: hypothetical protein QF694_05145, partial [Dehalococcoidia bacterium]|nr:hypothetical protein [Dehalococcoidia bacterium]